jgi:hypothetical protein
MKQTPSPRRRSEMLAEYDFRLGARGRYARRFEEHTNLVLLDPDVAEAFPTASDVNRALRSLIARASG